LCNLQRISSKFKFGLRYTSADLTDAPAFNDLSRVCVGKEITAKALKFLDSIPGKQVITGEIDKDVRASGANRGEAHVFAKGSSQE
jgi:hypothetical protein